MRIELTAVEILGPNGILPLKAQHALLEVTEQGEWRVLLAGLKVDSLTVLQDLFPSAGVAKIGLTSTEGDRTAGLVKVAKLSVGNVNGAVLQGLSPLP